MDKEVTRDVQVVESESEPDESPQLDDDQGSPGTLSE